MAISDNTRSQESRRSDEALQQLQQSFNEFKEQQGRMNDQLREMITGLNQQMIQIASHGGFGEVSSGNSNQPLSRLSRVEFPRFHGEDVVGWIYKCEQFFEIDQTVGSMQVKIASIHLSGKALLWHQSFMKNRGLREWPLWEEYKTAITMRFGAKPYDDPLAELMKIRQLGSVEAYQEQFDALINRVELPNAYAVSCFLSGLNDDIQSAVRMFKPGTLHDAYCLAKLQEATLASIARKTKPILGRSPSTVRSMGPRFEQSPPPWNPTTSRTGLGSFRSPVTSSVGSTASKPRTVGRTMSDREIDERRAKNQCFFCDEKYYPGHKCTSQVYRLEILEEENSNAQGDENEEAGEEQGEIQGDTEVMPQLSLSALNGISTFCTMRVTGRVKNSPIHILIDSGSTHNFLDISTAKKLHCEVKKIPPLQVGVANGQQMQCTAMCKNFAWSIMGRTFFTDVMLVSLGNWEMVLGVHWLSSLGPILWDFAKLRMEFQYEGQRVVLRGTQKSDMEWTGGKRFQQSLCKSAQLFALQVQPVLPPSSLQTIDTSIPEIQQLLREYEDIFAEPKGLPPHRALDHRKACRVDAMAAFSRVVVQH